MATVTIASKTLKTTLSATDELMIQETGGGINKKIVLSPFRNDSVNNTIGINTPPVSGISFSMSGKMVTDNIVLDAGNIIKRLGHAQTGNHTTLNDYFTDINLGTSYERDFVASAAGAVVIKLTLTTPIFFNINILLQTHSPKTGGILNIKGQFAASGILSTHTEFHGTLPSWLTKKVVFAHDASGYYYVIIGDATDIIDINSYYYIKILQSQFFHTNADNIVVSDPANYIIRILNATEITALSLTTDATNTTFAVFGDSSYIPGGLIMESTTETFRPPKMTTTQRNALTAVAGDQVYNTTTNQMNYYNGSTWVAY